MGVAQEIWQAFIRAHPEVTKGHLAMEDVSRKMAVFTQARNQQPHPDFEGFSPREGQLSGELSRAEATEEAILQLATT